jgi:hypothetical protein
MENYQILIYIVFIIVGLVFLFLAFNLNRKAKKAAESWPTVPGTVVNSSVTIRTSHSTKGQTRISHVPVVNYEYQVDEQKYATDRITFGSASFGKKKADAIVAAYPQGAPVTVHYDPIDPSKAVLETKAIGVGSNIFLGILLLAVGSLALIFLSN